MLWQMAEEFVRAEVPVEVVQGIRLGRMTALHKPSGGVRGIVVADTFRRAGVQSSCATNCRISGAGHLTVPVCSVHSFWNRVCRTCHTSPHRPDSTVLSVDGIGAFDLVSREAMLSGLRSMEGGDTLLPFVSQFYGQPSQYLWEDDEGRRVCHTIPQGEGGEQGDPLMPALFALGQHSALVAVQESLQPTERLMAFLDDVYLVSQPERTAVAHRELGHHLWTRAGSHCMRGRRRSGIGVADAHQVVKASSRQQESQTPTQWCGKVTRVYRRTNKESSSWERQ